jgi:hypothetical protein
MEITSFNYSVERGILLPPHVIKMNPLHQDDRLGFPVEHCVTPILMKESLEALIDAPFLGLGVASFLAQLHNLGGLKLVVVHHCPVGEDFPGSHLQALKFFGSGRSGTMRWGVLGRGILTKTVGPSPLGKLLELSGGNPT